MITFKLKQILAVVSISALACAWTASQYWIGAPKLSHAILSDRLSGPANEMIEAGERFVFAWPSDVPSIRYKCPYCQRETGVPIFDHQEFSAKDLSRFNKFTGLPKANQIEHVDIYCSGCERPLRVVGECAVWLGQWADSDMRGEVSYNQVIESEF